MKKQPTRLVLGPQRPRVYLRDAVALLHEPPRSMAVISAGWQEAENDIDDIREAVGMPLVDLELYRRAESVFAAVPELDAAYRDRQDRLKEQQRLYRLRLRPLAEATRQILRAEGDAEMIAAEQRHAIAQLRALDRHHMQRTDTIHRAFGEQFNAETVAELGRHREEIASILADVDAVLIAGGNLIVLLNRLRLFGMADVLAGHRVIGWSAGAMVLADRIVLYHDRMPQGFRDAEILGAGMGLVDGHVLLPDTTSRLRERDRIRISLMARRFSPDCCVTLDCGAAVQFEAGDRVAATDARKLQRNGRLGRLRVA